jgi:hypothetical protein
MVEMIIKNIKKEMWFLENQSLRLECPSIYLNGFWRIERSVSTTVQEGFIIL